MTKQARTQRYTRISGAPRGVLKANVAKSDLRRIVRETMEEKDYDEASLVFVWQLEQATLPASRSDVAAIKKDLSHLKNLVDRCRANPKKLLVYKFDNIRSTFGAFLSLQRESRLRRLSSGSWSLSRAVRRRRNDQPSACSNISLTMGTTRIMIPTISF